MAPIALAAVYGGDLWLLTLACTVGIIGTFAGFYLALAAGGDIKAGASVAIVSSLIGLPTALLMEYINTLFTDSLGKVLLGASVTAALAGFAWMKKIIDIEI